MDVAADTNVFLACFKPISITRRIMAIETLHVFCTEYQLSELQEHLNEVAAKYRLSKQFINDIMFFIENKVEIIPKEEYGHWIKKLEEAISDKDDLPLLALAHVKNIEIWSNDSHLKEQNKIRVLTTAELIELLQHGLI